LLPESILGVSIRARVAKMLGVEGYGNPIDDTKANTATSKPVVPENAAKVADVPNAVTGEVKRTDNKKTTSTPPAADNKKNESHWYNPLSGESNDKALAQKTQSVVPQVTETQAAPTTNIQPVETQATPVATVQPVEKNIVPDTTNEADNSSDSVDEMVDNQKEHSNLLKGLIEYQKQTAANTKALINAIAKMQGGGNTVSVNNVSSPTSFIQSPVTSSSFRQAILQR